MSDAFDTASCIFCQIANGRAKAPIVFENNETLAFLDHRPLFPGHTLLIPRNHFVTLADTPPALLSRLTSEARLLSIAMEEALGAEGSFVAINNRVSQSVPHLHIHVVPRKKGDGLKGFFWPRQKYRDDQHMEEIRVKLAASFETLQEKDG
jgi:histidine triad (HIT) family protein